MKLAGVRTADGAVVTLLFAPAGVLVLSRSARPHRLMRLGAGGVFAGFALAALAIGVANSLDRTAGGWLTAGAALVIVLGAAVTVLAAVLGRRLQRRFAAGSLAPTIPVEAVRDARSLAEQGRVTVSLTTTDDTTHDFSAAGQPGVQLAQQFATLLDVAPAA